MDEVTQNTADDDRGKKLGDADEVERERVVLRVPVSLSNHVGRL